MEDNLDAISIGKLSRKKYLNNFYFDPEKSNGLEKKLNQDFDKDMSRLIKKFSDNSELKIGRYGIYVEKDGNRATVFDEIAPSDLNGLKIQEILAQKSIPQESLGQFPNTEKDIFLKNGRFGPYIQMEDKMKSLPPGIQQEDVTLELAIDIISLPKNLGNMTDSDESIFVDIGRYGPYIKSGKNTRSITKDINMLEITLKQAIELLSAKKSRGSSIIKELGRDNLKNEIVIKNGRYGKFITNGKVNAPMPKNSSESDLSLEEAIKILSTRKPKKFKRR